MAREYINNISVYITLALHDHIFLQKTLLLCFLLVECTRFEALANLRIRFSFVSLMAFDIRISISDGNCIRRGIYTDSSLLFDNVLEFLFCCSRINHISPSSRIVLRFDKNLIVFYFPFSLSSVYFCQF